MAAYMRYSAVAERLGISATMFYSRRAAMEAEGFPKPDPIFRMYHGADVDAWITSRRKLPDPDTVTAGVDHDDIDFDAL